MKLIRKAIGPDVKLRVDGNMGWQTAKQAIQIIRAMEEHNLELVEQPLPAYDLDGMAEVRRSIAVDFMNGRQFPLYCTANDTLRNRRDLDIIFSKSRPLLLLGLPLHLGKSGCGLLDVRGEVRELLHLSNFNYLILRTGASLCPFDCFFLRLHLDHPVTAESLLRLGKRPVANLGLPSRE